MQQKMNQIIPFFFLIGLLLLGFSNNTVNAIEIPSNIEEEQVLNSNTKIEGFAISNDGNLIALADMYDVQFEIYSLNGIKQENIPLPQGISFYGDNSGIQFYHNTSEIFFIGYDSTIGTNMMEQGASLYRINIANHSCNIVKQGVRFFEISPDEHQIVFSANNEDNNGQSEFVNDQFSSIYIMDIYGNDVSLLKHISDVTFVDFDWNSKGDQILIEGWGEGASFWKISEDGSNFQRITSLGVITENPTWTLNNKYIICTGQNGQGGGTGIEIMGDDGSNRTIILPDDYIAELEHHPSLNYIYYTAPGEYTLNRIDVGEIINNGNSSDKSSDSPFNDVLENIPFGSPILFIFLSGCAISVIIFKLKIAN